MDVKLESLIEKIKKDGIEEAEKASQDIIGKAEQRAEDIIKQANVQAEQLKEKAEVFALKLKNNTEASLKQAVRDLVLTLKNELIVLFDRILKDKIGEALSPDFMNSLIVKIIDKWPIAGNVDWEILVNKSDKEKLGRLLTASLKKQAKGIIEVKVSKTVDKGFRIGIKGEDLHYDFTDQSILESLKEFLNPSLRAMLDASNG